MVKYEYSLVGDTDKWFDVTNKSTEAFVDRVLDHTGRDAVRIDGTTYRTKKSGYRIVYRNDGNIVQSHDWKRGYIDRHDKMVQILEEHSVVCWVKAFDVYGLETTVERL